MDDQAAVGSLYAEIQRRRAAGWEPSLVDVVPAARSVLLDGLADPGGTARRMRTWSVPPAPTEVGSIIEIGCVYDGPDLATVAHSWGVSEADVAAVHASIEHQVAFCGFGPGFAYMTGIGEARSVARRANPRTAVPAGSVALAGEYTGIYPRRSPGGWNLIGRTAGVMWDAERARPALLNPGDRVRFVVLGP